MISSDYTVPDTDIVVRVYRPAGNVDPLPAVYSIHGGGYIIGTYEMMDATFERWCPRLGCVGLSVEYRLAPETPYPGPLDDCYAGLQWAIDNHEQLGIDTLVSRHPGHERGRRARGRARAARARPR